MGKVLRTAYATYPTVKLQGYKTDAKTGAKKFGFVKELLFGDYMRPYITQDGEYEKLKVGGKEYVKVRCRNVDGYLLESEMQEARPLEVNFVDVGQGDGCHIVTPDDKHFIVDAGEGDNMYRFLKWRFNLRTAKVSPPPFTIVMSHPDQDHYQGFGKLFTLTKGTAQQFKIDKVYHNGIVGVPGSGLNALGTIVKKDGVTYVTDLVENDADFAACVKKGGNGNFLKLLKKTDAPKESLHLGSDPIYQNEAYDLKMEILGPVSVTIDGKTAIPAFASNVGKTKNGNSVVIKLTMGHLRMLLGGDLNTESEYLLLKQFSGIDIEKLKKDLGKAKLSDAERAAKEAEIEAAILKARETLEVDIAKSCHHGSADFTSEFLRALNPVATVISSGDEEPHTHPRPDTLGTIGKHSRGERSLIFSTELARSGKEFVELDKIKNTDKKKERAVTVYGMINVRTDGNKVIIAQKLESAAVGRNWDVHKLEWNEKTGQFEYLCKFE